MSTIQTWIRAIRVEADAVRSFELCPVEGLLPLAEAGAHIDLHLPGGFLRQYSLLAGSNRNGYRIAVGLGPDSRGGARTAHTSLSVGSQIDISAPRNHFRLHDQQDGPSILLAGGIGITPIYAMAAELTHQKRHWQLYYCARTSAHAAFRSELNRLQHESEERGSVNFIFDQEPGQHPLDIAGLISRYADGPAHFYCCGPSGMLKAFQHACQELPVDRVHFESFSAAPADITKRTAQQPFTVHLARSGKSILVPADRSILDSLADHGIRAFCSCREGICGSCETKVLEGTPEHRDSVLSYAEKEAANTMMICVSRCKGDALTLDL